MTPDKPIVAWRYRHGTDDSWRVTQQRPECAQCESVPLVFQSDLAAAQARVKELEAQLETSAQPVWYTGSPPFPQDQEWFIALTKYGDKVVLRALPEDYAYDYTTADHTYMKRENVIRWRQFPDCEYLPPALTGD